MEVFLASIEKRAFCMIRITTGDTDDALDILQDAMLGFVRSYSHKPRDEWKPLFYRIVQNKIRDWQRRTWVRYIVTPLFQFKGKGHSGDDKDIMQFIEDPDAANPYTKIMTGEAMRRLETTLQKLPARQRQVFLLRVWEGFSVQETARAMGCSEGTVKTHYHRAVNQLRESLQGVWP